VALVRTAELSSKTAECLQGAQLLRCNVLDAAELQQAYAQIQPLATICCLASRSGVKSDAWEVDYGGGKNALRAQESVHTSTGEQGEVGQGAQGAECARGHFVLLSAFCCGKPLLEFQFAKIALEELIKASSVVSHSLVRPTAYFKSLDGQLESAKKGYPMLYFGSGSCSANAICEMELAQYLVDCALRPAELGMLDGSRDIGGPDNPPVTKIQQLSLIYDSLGVPTDGPRPMVCLPVGVLDFLIAAFGAVQGAAAALQLESLRQKGEDAAEIARIVRYYATEPMVALGEGQVQGSTRLADHFRRIAERGGLEEVDKMTTTMGVLEVFSKSGYARREDATV